MDKYKTDAALFLGLAGFSMGLYSLFKSGDTNDVDTPKPKRQRKMRRYSTPVSPSEHSRSSSASRLPRKSVLDDSVLWSRKSSRPFKRKHHDFDLAEGNEFKIVKITDSSPVLLVQDTRYTTKDIDEESDFEASCSSLCEIISEHTVIPKQGETEPSFGEFDEDSDAETSNGGDDLEFCSSVEGVVAQEAILPGDVLSPKDLESLNKGVPRQSGGDIMACDILPEECDMKQMSDNHEEMKLSPRSRLKERIRKTPTESLALDDFIFE